MIGTAVIPWLMLLMGLTTVIIGTWYGLRQEDAEKGDDEDGN